MYFLFSLCYADRSKTCANVLRKTKTQFAFIVAHPFALVIAFKTMFIYQELSDAQKTYVRRVCLALITLIGVFVFVYAGYYAALWKQVVRQDLEPFQISVSGEGKIAAKPDVAVLGATIKTEQPALKDAQKENTDASQKVVNFLKLSGIAEKDIRTSFYNIAPQYQYTDCPIAHIEIYPPRPCPPLPKPRIIGYQVTNAYEIKVRDLGKAGDILEGVVGAGANEVSGLSFGIDDEDALKADARKQAIDDAQAKAKVLARQLGVRLGRIASFSEGGGARPIFYERALAVAKADSAESAPVPVEAGEREILANVTIVYEMK